MTWMVIAFESRRGEKFGETHAENSGKRNRHSVKAIARNTVSIDRI